MRTILFIIQKEFLQIKRDKTLLPIIFVVPIVQLLFLVYAATFEIKNIDLCIVDNDLSSSSREIAQKFEASPFFNITGKTFSIEDAEKLIETDDADIAIIIPHDFERDLVRNKTAGIQILVNSIDQTTGSIGNSYCQQIIMSYNKQIITTFADIKTLTSIKDSKSININHQFWYNPELNYKIFMVPGILVILITIIGMFLSAMNLVKEKEVGTIEQINVTPIKKHQFIIGKMVPFLLIALFELAFGLTLGKIIFNVPIVGNLGVVFIAATVYLFVVLGFGLLISTMSNTQQQAMFVAWFFMLVFIMMSGLFTPTDNMPDWAQKLNYINPVAYFIKIIRMVLLKGSGILDIKKELLSLFGYGVIVFSLATLRYRKTS
ncbi:MAG: ABC transporter permease [Bacteroidales bacterium]|nr:ABC transporter permease [Bacteroidales bacterium]